MKLVALITGFEDQASPAALRYQERVIRDCLQRGEAPFATVRMYLNQNVMHMEEAELDWMECASKLVVDEGIPLSVADQEMVRQVVEMGIDVEYRNLKKRTTPQATAAGNQYKYLIPDPYWEDTGVEALVHVIDEHSRDWALDMLVTDGQTIWWDADAEIYKFGPSRADARGTVKEGTMVVKWAISGWLSNTEKYVTMALGDKAVKYKTPRSPDLKPLTKKYL